MKNNGESIRAVTDSDAGAIAEIYNWYVLNSVISFETVAVSAEEMGRRIARVTADNPWLVLEREGRVLGYAYSTNWKSRAAYRWSKESSVYIHHEHCGNGWGRSLMQALIERLKQDDVHVLIAGISLPNEASVVLHEKLGFRQVGTFVEVGEKFERSVDVAYWQLIL